MGHNRRVFMGVMAAGAAALAAPAVLGQGRPRVVVIGGGPGGATVARYLAKDSAGAIAVTLIEPQRIYNTCFFGNLYIGGFWAIEDTGFGYATLARDYGVNVVHEFAVGVDRDARTVTTGSGATIAYDRLVVAPGIDFKEGAVPGWDLAAQGVMPHAFKGGTQVQLLRAQVAAMPPGGVFAMVVPPNPYRCPPGPYERICMIAHLLTRINPTAKILIVDPKETFSKQALFEEAWARHYPGMITRIGPDFGGKAVAVRPETMEIVIDGVAERVDACNVIPAMRAGNIAALAGITNEAGWAPIEPFTMASRADPAVFVLGDASQQGDMPKSAFSANSQAKVAANVIRGQLTGSRIFPARYANTCWSLLGPEDGVKVGATYEPTPEKIATVEGFISQTGEDAALRRATFEESLGWFAAITADMFG
jgi:NADPH-dependent 2,4-dienoyl-CoA reductase/sulfur reductase-like enzyme